MCTPRTVFALLVLVAVMNSPASAQSGDGFLFHSPRMLVGVHGGFARSDADSELFDFVTDLLTLNRDDFDGFVGGGSLGIPLNDYVVVEGRVSFIGRSRSSEFRHFVDLADLPIEQTTEYFRTPVLAGIKVYPGGLGDRVGSFAWVPRGWNPYLGAAGGMMWYRFRQTGDFVDFDTNDIFADVLDSEGWTPAATGFVGIDINLTSRFYLSADGSYLWASTDLDRDFENFNKIDLSGFAGSLGFSLRL